MKKIKSAAATTVGLLLAWKIGPAGDFSMIVRNVLLRMTYGDTDA